MATPDLDRRLLEQIVSRVGRGNYPQWAARLAATGNCAHPVRLRGQITATNTATGEQTVTFTSAHQPDRVLLKACGSRRATRCPACAAVYRSDARALILAGLLGGKGIDPAVNTHPLAFVTLTAPSYGPVHTAAGTEKRTCQPGPATRHCPHGQRRCCNHRHDSGDPLTGQPLCPGCYDHAGAVIWNARSTELWQRTAIGIRRRLAAALGLTIRQLRQEQTLAFIKVAEYQQRGLVHFHALIRVDPNNNHPVLPGDVLADAITATLPRVHAPNPQRPEQPIRWGTQCTVIPLPTTERSSVAGYLAKYATKSVDTGGALDHRLHHGDLTNYPLPDHLRTLAETAWNLGVDPALAELNLRHWAHTLGYRGHWLTKSRTWSTTLTQLRTDRHTWQLNRHRTNQRESEKDLVETGEWTYHGTGHTNDGDTWLATNANHNHQQSRRTAWEERP